MVTLRGLCFSGCRVLEDPRRLFTGNLSFSNGRCASCSSVGLCFCGHFVAAAFTSLRRVFCFDVEIGGGSLLISNADVYRNRRLSTRLLVIQNMNI